MRKLMTWLTLLAAVTFVVPRAWIHGCHAFSDLHANEVGSSGDQLDHADCQFCDFAATPSLQPQTIALLSAPSWEATNQIWHEGHHGEKRPLLAALRGPPLA